MKDKAKAKKAGKKKKKLVATLFQNRAFSLAKISGSYHSIQDKIKFAEIQKELHEFNQEVFTSSMMDTAQESVKKQQSTKKKWVNGLFLAINLAILVGVLIYQFCNEDPVSFSDLINSKINWWWLLIAVALFMLINFTDSLRVYILIRKKTGRHRPWLSLKSVMTCRFYDFLTPLSTGGQPFQIFYLNKRGLNASVATSVPIAKYIFSQICALVFCVIILVCNSAVIINFDPIVMTFCYIGLIANVCLVVGVLWLSSSKKIAPACAKGILKLCHKLHFIKDYEKAFNKVMAVVQEYIMTSRNFLGNIGIVILQVIFSVITIILTYSIPFVIYCTFVGFDMDMYFTLFLFAVISDLAVSVIPLPGGAGVAELAFWTLFPIGPEVMVWAMLLWRIFTYYGYLIQGGLLLLYDFAIGNKKIEPLLQRFKEEDENKELWGNAQIQKTKSNNKRIKIINNKKGKD